MLDAHDPEAIYAEALALLACHRTAGVTPDLGALVSTPPRQRTTGTPEERAEQRLARRQLNALTHREAQAAHDQERPPTRQQRRLLWCLGYREPVPKSRAEVAALLAELQERPLAATLGILVNTARSIGSLDD